MHAVCAKILGAADEAAEVTNQAVAKALKTPPPAGCANTRAWLCRVARNATYDFLRRKETARKHLVSLETTVDSALPHRFRASDLGLRVGDWSTAPGSSSARTRGPSSTAI
jgi:DNA-directed RNA polymerase specialized sigma24 family protein